MKWLGEGRLSTDFTDSEAGDTVEVGGLSGVGVLGMIDESIRCWEDVAEEVIC